MLLRKWMKKKRIPQNRVSLQKTLCTRLLSLIKKKKMQELEKLLNSLVQRGWRPRGKYDKILNVSKYNGWLMRLVQSNNAWMYVHIRSIVSLESGLWQFVCDRSLLKSIWKARAKEPSISALGFKSEFLALSFEPEYRLLESALIPEEELEKFLIENIVIEWNSK